MLNKSILIGRLAQDPELRYTTEGTPVCNFSLAVQRNFTNREGKKETDFIDIVAWRKTAESSAEYLKKGRMVAVAGRLQIRKNTGKQGRTFVNPEVVAQEIKFLDNNSPVKPEPKPKAKEESKPEFENDREPTIDLEDIDEDIEVPF